MSYGCAWLIRRVTGWLLITWTFYLRDKPVGVPCPWMDRILWEATPDRTPSVWGNKFCLKVEVMQVGYLYSMASTQADVAGVI